MVLKCLGSGSSGNCYIIETNKESLILELGLPWGEILKGLDYNLSNIVGACVSHAHGDHAKSIKDAVKFGLPVYSCKDVCDIHKGVRLLETGKKYRIGNFYVQAISVPHSCECYAYIIDHEECGRILFITDCTRFNYRVKGCNHIWIEANYSEDVLISNLCNDEMSRSLYGYHMEIKDTLLALENNYNPNIQDIILLHLSDRNSDEKDFRAQVMDKLGFQNVIIASKGIEVALNKSEF